MPGCTMENPNQNQMEQNLQKSNQLTNQPLIFTMVVHKFTKSEGG